MVIKKINLIQTMLSNYRKSNILVISVSVIMAIIFEIKYPTERSFENMNYVEHKKQTITELYLFIISVILPFLLLLKSQLDHILLYFSIHFINLMITNILKCVVGRLRPDFLGRCIPVGNICTGNDFLIKDGRRSFPSGHMSITTVGYTYLSFVAFKSSLKLFIICMFFEIFIITGIGYTRVVDNWHFMSDLIFGFFLGMTVMFSMHYIVHKGKFLGYFDNNL